MRAQIDNCTTDLLIVGTTPAIGLYQTGQCLILRGRQFNVSSIHYFG